MFLLRNFSRLVYFNSEIFPIYGMHVCLYIVLQKSAHPLNFLYRVDVYLNESPLLRELHVANQNTLVKCKHNVKRYAILVLRPEEAWERG